MSQDISSLQVEIGQWALTNFPKAGAYQPLLGIAEEVGELCHAHLKMEQGIRGTYEKHKADKEDAVGDIFVFLMHYCLLNSIDAAQVIQSTWNRVRLRDWQANKENGDK